jgi:hypothetical protein
MKTKLLTLAAVAALAINAGSANALTPATPGAEIGPQISTDNEVEQAGYYWRYREFRRGNCKFKTLYVTNGYRWAYRYRYHCSRSNILSRKSG